MKQLRLLNPDTKCVHCSRVVSRKKAEAEDWIEIIFCDATGMAIRKDYICQKCEPQIVKAYEKYESKWD